MPMIHFFHLDQGQQSSFCISAPVPNEFNWLVFLHENLSNPTHERMMPFDVSNLVLFQFSDSFLRNIFGKHTKETLLLNITHTQSHLLLGLMADVSRLLACWVAWKQNDRSATKSFFLPLESKECCSFPSQNSEKERERAVATITTTRFPLFSPSGYRTHHNNGLDLLETTLARSHSAREAAERGGGGQQQQQPQSPWNQKKRERKAFPHFCNSQLFFTAPLWRLLQPP